MSVQAYGYSCLCCGAELKWDPHAGCFQCEYCGSKFHEADLQLDSPTPKQAEPQPVLSTDAKTGEQVMTYTCTYCGAEVITTPGTAASFCVYCQRPMIMSNNLSGKFQPKYVIPFVNTRKDAKIAFQNFIDGKVFLPDSYIADQNIEKITGVYVPFWIFDTDMSFNTALTGETKEHRSDAKYNYTVTNHYNLFRTGQFRVNGVPADGASKIDDFTMAAIGPFDWGKLQEFSLPYLSGFLAERYDVGAEQVFDDVVIKKLNKSLDEKIEQSCKRFSAVHYTVNNRCVSHMHAEYALLPVWLLYSQFEGQSYVFAMNGQSGKLRGNLPIDKKKVAYYAAKVMAITTVAVGTVATVLSVLGVL